MDSDPSDSSSSSIILFFVGLITLPVPLLVQHITDKPSKCKQRQ